MNLFGNIKFKDYIWYNDSIIRTAHNKNIVRRNDKIYVDDNYKNAKILAISDNIVLFSAKTNEGDITDICHISKIKKRNEKGR